MRNLVQTLKLSGSRIAMIAATISFGTTAQAQDQTGAPVEQVQVSASRISIAGYTAPTPVTVVDSATLTRDAQVDIGDELRQLPAVGQSNSPDFASHAGNASQGNADLSDVDLRNLGQIRTLVLFDGQRVVMSNPNSGTPPFAIGGVDLQTLPQTVIQRIDVVTGGASAAWGSDAVAGVVNLIVNKTFTGIKGNFAVGDSYKDDHRQAKAELFVGTDVLDGRGHIEAAASYVWSPDSVLATHRGWYWGQPQIVPSASLGLVGAPTYVTLHGVTQVSGSAQFTNGGLITANPAGTVAGTANILKGTQFVGPNAQVAPFNFGDVYGSSCVYCSASPYTNTSVNLLAAPFHNFTFFNYDSYRLTNNITASIMLNFGKESSEGTSSGRQGTVVINSGNPYIPASVQATMTANGIPSFTLGTSTAGAMNPYDPTPADAVDGIGVEYQLMQRQLMRGVFSLDGAFTLLGQDWAWKAYIQNSVVREVEREPYGVVAQDYSNAINAVTVTAAGANSLGGGNAALAAQVAAALTAAGAPVPQVGQIVCKSSLTSTSWGTTTNATTGITSVQPGGLTPFCAPLNLFGTGNASPQALNYIAPGRISVADLNRGFWYMGQSVIDVSVQGELPWGFPAGHVAVATGYSYRLEQQTNKRDPLQIGSSGAYPSGNFSQWSGEYYANEGFLEINAPVLKNDVVDSLDVNAAGRVTDYSTSGLVETWKVGFTSQVNEDIRFRATVSADIRAPDVSELFAGPLFGVTQYPYPPPQGKLYTAHSTNSGNPNLVPEEAQTWTEGVVLTPHWIPNLSLSADWYSIDIHKAIYANSITQILSECAMGNATYCSLVFFGKGFPGNTLTPVASEVDGNGKPASGFFASVGTFPADCEGCFNLAFISPLNAALEATSGLDFQIDYTNELWDNSTLSWHLLGNYTDKNSITVLGQTYDEAGIYGGGGYVNPLAGNTTPKLNFRLSATYAQGPYEFTVQTRYIGSARVAPTYVTGVDIDHNWIAPRAYLDLRGSYQWSDKFQFYLAVDNLQNIPPGEIGGTAVYDALGRAYRIGVRFND